MVEEELLMVRNPESADWEPSDSRPAGLLAEIAEVVQFEHPAVAEAVFVSL